MQSQDLEPFQQEDSELQKHFYSFFVENQNGKRDQLLREAFKETNERLEDTT